MTFPEINLILALQFINSVIFISFFVKLLTPHLLIPCYFNNSPLTTIKREARSATINNKYRCIVQSASTETQRIRKRESELQDYATSVRSIFPSSSLLLLYDHHQGHSLFEGPANVDQLGYKNRNKCVTQWDNLMNILFEFIANRVPRPPSNDPTFNQTEQKKKKKKTVKRQKHGPRKN